jgi:hypothetical protein
VEEISLEDMMIHEILIVVIDMVVQTEILIVMVVEIPAHQIVTVEEMEIALEAVIIQIAMDLI